MEEKRGNPLPVRTLDRNLSLRAPGHGVAHVCPSSFCFPTSIPFYSNGTLYQGRCYIEHLIAYCRCGVVTASRLCYASVFFRPPNCCKHELQLATAGNQLNYSPRALRISNWYTAIPHIVFFWARIGIGSILATQYATSGNLARLYLVEAYVLFKSQ